MKLFPNKIQQEPAFIWTARSVERSASAGVPAAPAHRLNLCTPLTTVSAVHRLRSAGCLALATVPLWAGEEAADSCSRERSLMEAYDTQGQSHRGPLMEVLS